MSLNELASEIHQINVGKGFWEADRNVGEVLMLAVSELSEALEEHRAGRGSVYYKHAPGCAISDWRIYQSPGESEPSCTCTPKPEGVAVEVIDCLIRCLDFLHSTGIDIDKVTAEKLAFNRSRPHKHGKAY